MDSNAERMARLRRLIGGEEDLLEMLGIPKLSVPNETQPVGTEQGEKDKDVALADAPRKTEDCVKESLEVKREEVLELEKKEFEIEDDERPSGSKVGNKVAVNKKTENQSPPDPNLMQFPNSVIADEVLLLRTVGEVFPEDVKMEDLKDELLHDKTTTFGQMQEILQDISNEMKYNAETCCHPEVVKLIEEDPRENVSMLHYIDIQIRSEFRDNFYCD